MFQIYMLVYDISRIFLSVFLKIHINPNTTNLDWIPVIWIWYYVKYIFYSKIFSSILILCSPGYDHSLFLLWLFTSGFLTRNHVYFVLAWATGDAQAETWVKNKMTIRTEFKLQGFDHELCHFHSQEPKPKLVQGWCIRAGKGRYVRDTQVIVTHPKCSELGWRWSPFWGCFCLSSDL